VADRPLQIGIDARELTGQPTGVGRYLAGLLREWTPAATPHRFTLFVPHDRLAEPVVQFLPALNAKVVVVPTATPGTWWEQSRLPAAAARAGIDAWFSPGYSLPLRLGCPSVVAIHDLSFFAHPEWFGWREGMRRRWLARAAAGRARAVITISAFSAGEIARWLRVAHERIRLAAPGAPAIASTPAGRRAPIALFVGSLFNRRRIPEMIQAFAAAASAVPGAQLILVGDNRTHPRIDPGALARALGVGDRVVWRAYVSDADLEALYDRARVFLFLSEYEGFAMTPLEALAHGVPPVLLDTPVAREVYGSAATLVSDDGGRASLAQALIDLLTDDAAHAEATARGRALLSRYRWSDAAAVVMAALEEAARSR